MLTGTCHCGATHWTLEGDPGPVTACNCTLCRRYGSLWAYDYVNERIRVSGPMASYTRAGKDAPSLEILFCPTCACVRLARLAHRRVRSNTHRSQCPAGAARGRRRSADRPFRRPRHI